MKQEMDLILNRENIKEDLVNAWIKFVPSIKSYGSKVTKKIVVTYLYSFDHFGTLQFVVTDTYDTFLIGREVDDADQESMPFKILCEVLTPKNIKDSIDHNYLQVMCS